MNILDEIIKNKQKELSLFTSDKEKFKKIFSDKKASIIWEIKLASPNFDYSKNINLDKLMSFYWNNDKIKAVSNLIDSKYFSWDIKRGMLFKSIYNKPIFFKEFVIDKKQIDWAFYFWYDAILLLERCLSNDKMLVEFIKYSNSKNIYPIVEVDNEEWFSRILNIWYDLDFWIAINSRNLWNMKIDRNVYFDLYEKFKNNLWNRLIFAFSWIENLEQVSEYEWKCNWVLIWTYFIKNMIS